MNEMGVREMHRRIKTVMVARLATVRRDGRPHIVPITFALADDNVLYFVIDDKPKRTTNLQRLRNIESQPFVSILIDHYEDDWTRLWWVRADGTARVLREGAEFDHAILVLSARYPQYRSARPPGPVVAITVERLTGWSAS